MNYDLFSNATSSPGSECGASPPASPVSPTMRPCGRDHALASLSARQAKERDLLTSGTSGPRSIISSNNANLRSRLANKLRELTAIYGSTLYRLTWTQRVMPSGLRKPSLRASERRTSDPAITGWPTATATDSERRGVLDETNPNVTLNLAAQLAGWPTTGTDSFRSRSGDRKGEMGLDQMARSMGEAVLGPARLTAGGEMLIGSRAGIKSGGQLSPRHSLWLMLGPFATAWASCGERVTRSRSGKRLGGSKRSATPLAIGGDE